MDTTLIVPGLNGSGSDHWQSWFERQIPDSVRVEQSDWGTPDLSLWSAQIHHALNRNSGRIYIVAHSFGCLAAVQTAHDHGERIAGLMLVAPADPARFGLQNVITNGVLGAHSVVVASTNDPWMPIDRAAAWAEAWGSELINLGAAGHINVSSGYGAWPRGLAIYRSLRGDVPRSIAQRRAHDALHAGDF